MASFVFTVFSLGFSGKLSMNTRSIEIDEVTECHSQGTVKYQGSKEKDFNYMLHTTNER